jgi:hypothetical protein
MGLQMRPPVLDLEKFEEDEQKIKARIASLNDNRQAHTFFGKTKRVLGSVRSIGASVFGGTTQRSGRHSSNASSRSRKRSVGSPNMRLSVSSSVGGGGSVTGRKMGTIGRTDAGPVALEDLKNATASLNDTVQAIQAIPPKPKRGAPKIQLPYVNAAAVGRAKSGPSVCTPSVCVDVSCLQVLASE